MLIYFPAPPTVTIISPNFPTVRSSGLDSYTVSYSHRGLIVSCIAIGSPSPTVEWTKNGQVVSGSAVSVSQSTERSIYHVALLLFTKRFTRGDVGVYSCQARSSSVLQEKAIRLEFSESAVYPYQVMCLDLTISAQIFFRIRVLNTTCQHWTSELRVQVAASIQNTLISVVSTECQSKCSLTQENIVITSSPGCSDNVNTTAVIVGSITTNSSSVTSQISCILDRWYQRQPQIQLLPGSSMHNRLDVNCSFLIDSPADTTCDVEMTEPPPLIPVSILQYAAVGLGWGLLWFLYCMLMSIFTIRAYKSNKM